MQCQGTVLVGLVLWVSVQERCGGAGGASVEAAGVLCFVRMSWCWHLKVKWEDLILT